MKRKKVLKKLRNKYRFSILNDETFEEVLHFRLSRLNVLILVGGFSIGLITLVTLLIAFTPIREFIPGYPDGKTRKGYVQNALVVDSLEHIIEQWKHYNENLKTILSGGDPINVHGKVDTGKPLKPIDFSRSEEDSLLRVQIEADEMYNLSLSDMNEPKATVFIFIQPVKGIITNKFNPLAKHYGVDLVAAPNEVVLSVAKGTVIYSGWSVETGYTITIQHSNNFISVYKHNSKLLKRQGDIVEAGDVIAIIGNSGELTTGPHLHFELWQDGKPLDPTKMIHF